MEFNPNIQSISVPSSPQFIPQNEIIPKSPHGVIGDNRKIHKSYSNPNLIIEPLDLLSSDSETYSLPEYYNSTIPKNPSTALLLIDNQNTQLPPISDILYQECVKNKENIVLDIIPYQENQFLTNFHSNKNKKKLNYICKDFLNGKCHRGNHCKFIHNIDNSIHSIDKSEICRDFIKGKCFRGNSCRYLHTFN